MRTSNTKKNRQKMVALLAAMLLFFVTGIFAGRVVNNRINKPKLDEEIPSNIDVESSETQPDNSEIKDDDSKEESLPKIGVWTIEGKKQVIYEPEGIGYRYGPSILSNEDGSVDIWIVSPGNNSTEWDHIRYIHSDDRVNWSDERVVLRPTRNSNDQCSVCDPAVIVFNDYYYLGYTSTSDYERNGFDNSVFVARSKYPEGPFEKWDGNGWGGDPEPIIEYNDDPDGWGIGEVSFVIKDEELYLYYTYNNNEQLSLCMAKADLCENWPSTIRDNQVVIEEKGFDATEVVYVEDVDMFLAFGITEDFSPDSRLTILKSKDGVDFSKRVDTNETIIDIFSINMGVEKDGRGHVKTGEELFIGYGFGNVWAQWTGRLRAIIIAEV